jgi:ubiquinone/menaquinone biosynthesis C-methylase UbiE
MTTRPRPSGARVLMNTTTRTNFDTELRRHNDVLRQACGIQVHDHILDIGCGTGQTTRQAALIAQAGSALGIDVSAPSIERARQLARTARLRNVVFEQADAQTYRFPPDRFDVAISRFGTMFFDDPVAAFANIARALRPAGRLVMMVWQAHEHNEWIVAINRALEAVEAPVADISEDPNPFSLAYPQNVTDILETAGFADITFTDIREPVCYGVDIATALDWIRGFTCTSEALKRLDTGTAERTLRRLRDTLAEHTSDDGVWFDSRAWIVTARRAHRAEVRAFTKMVNSRCLGRRMPG